VDLILIILGISGSAAIVGATYVFTVSARNYNLKGKKQNLAGAAKPRLQLVQRSTRDRRGGRQLTFPCAANGVLVTTAEIVIGIWRLFLPLWPIVCAAAAIIGIDELGGFL